MLYNTHRSCIYESSCNESCSSIRIPQAGVYAIRDGSRRLPPGRAPRQRGVHPAARRRPPQLQRRPRRLAAALSLQGPHPPAGGAVQAVLERAEASEERPAIASETRIFKT